MPLDKTGSVKILPLTVKFSAIAIKTKYLTLRTLHCHQRLPILRKRALLILRKWALPILRKRTYQQFKPFFRLYTAASAFRFSDNNPTDSFNFRPPTPPYSTKTGPLTATSARPSTPSSSAKTDLQANGPTPYKANQKSDSRANLSTR